MCNTVIYNAFNSLYQFPLVIIATETQEIIKDMPFIAEVKNRWPALFSETEVILTNFVIASHFHKNLYLKKNKVL